MDEDEEYARLAQEREIAIQRAQQSAQISIDSATRKREADEARIGADEAIEKATLHSDALLKEERQALERRVRESEIQNALVG